MVELKLSVGDSDANLLETAIVLFSLTNMLQWCFFIMIILVKLHNKKENAPRQKMHSQTHNRKGR